MLRPAGSFPNRSVVRYNQNSSEAMTLFHIFLLDCRNLLFKPSHLSRVLGIMVIHCPLLNPFEVLHLAFNNSPATRRNARLESAAQDDDVAKYVRPSSV